VFNSLVKEHFTTTWLMWTNVLAINLCCYIWQVDIITSRAPTKMFIIIFNIKSLIKRLLINNLNGVVLEKLTGPRIVKRFPPHIMEPNESQPQTAPIQNQVVQTRLFLRYTLILLSYLCLPSILFTSHVHNKILYAFLPPTCHMIGLSHPLCFHYFNNI
jgi:hypothetical protein